MDPTRMVSERAGRRRPGLRRLWLAAAGCLVLGTASTLSTRAAAAPVPPGTFSPVGSIPNWFYQHHTRSADQSATQNVAAFADPVNHRLFEGSTYWVCPALVEMDIDTYAVRATSGGGSQCSQATDPAAGTPSASRLPPMTIDPVDHLVFGVTLTNIVVIDEDTLGLVTHWTLPAAATAPDPYAEPVSVSWSAKGDELLVFSADYGNFPTGNPTPPGTHLAAYDIPASLHQKHGVPLWSTPLRACASGFSVSYFSPDAAYRATGEPAIYVPCNVSGGDNQQGVDKLGLTSQGCANGAPECPDGSEFVAVAPGGANGFLFDPASDRALLPTSSGGISATVYSGHEATIAGRTTIGSSADDNETAVGLDTATGRMYAISGHTGLTIIDGRRTPIPQGIVLRQYADAVPGNEFPVLPPDAAFPYTRVVINHNVGFNPAVPNTGAQPDFTVYADTLPVSHDPASGQVDQNTTAAVPPGATTATVYGGDARGYGYHLDYVGGYGGSLSDVSGGDVGRGVPLAGTTDTLAATVDQLSVDNLGAEGRAAALEDGTGGTSYDYSLCTGAGTVAQCLPPPSCPTSGCPTPPPAPPGAPAPPATNQSWPYPDAHCDSATPTGSTSGTYVTPPGGSGSPAAAPGTSAAGVAVATVSCALAGGRAEGRAHTGSVQATATGLPLVSVGSGDVLDATVTPPSGDAGVTSHTVAEARGITIDLGGGNTVAIGAVVQEASATAAGRPGTATTRRSVSVSGVRVGGTELCSGQCSLQAVVDELNSAFPAQMHVSAATADDRYDSHVNAAGEGQGSPGGYIAAVQAGLDEQYGDEQFNSMSPEEAAYLPALRIVLYSVGDGHPTISRQILDLAGVDDDARLGVHVLPSFEQTGQLPDVPAAAVAAGVPSPPGRVIASGPAAAPAGAPGAVATPPPAVAPGRGSGLLESVYGGLDWARNSPGEVLQMAAFLSLLGLPLVVMRRRWGWGRESIGGAS